MTAPVPDHAMINPSHARKLLSSVPASPRSKTWTFSGAIGPGNYGWWKVFIDSEGALSIMSDYGNYGSHWSRSGIGKRTSLQFFLDCDDSYLLQNFARRDWFNVDASRKSARELLLEMRRDMGRACSREEQERADAIRAAWDGLKNISDKEDWENWQMRQSHHIDSYEFWNCTAMDYQPQALAFFEKVWPRVREQIRSEVERGESGGAMEAQP